MKELNCKSTEHLIGLIELMIYKGGKPNFVIINLGQDFYMQMYCDKGSYQMHCESVSNYYLAEEHQLTEAKIDKLKELNWNLINPETNYEISYPVDSEKSRFNLAKLLLQTAHEVYNIKEINANDFNIQLG